MAMVYITGETKEKLERLIDCEKRTLSTEVDFLCSERMKQLNIPENADPSVNGNSKIAHPESACQEKNVEEV